MREWTIENKIPSPEARRFRAIAALTRTRARAPLRQETSGASRQDGRGRAGKYRQKIPFESMTWMECKRKDSNTIVSARSASIYVCVIGEEIVPAEAVGSHFELRLRRVFAATAELQRSNAHNPTHTEAARRSNNRKRRNRTCCNNIKLIIRLYYTSIQS